MKNPKKAVEEAPVADELANIQAEALAEELARLQGELDAEKERTRALKSDLDALRATLATVTNSISIDPPPPPPLERPIVTVNGHRLQFKSGALSIKGRRYLATEIAADDGLLEDIVARYPGSFEAV